MSVFAALEAVFAALGSLVDDLLLLSEGLVDDGLPLSEELDDDGLPLSEGLDGDGLPLSEELDDDEDDASAAASVFLLLA